MLLYHVHRPLPPCTHCVYIWKSLCVIHKITNIYHTYMNCTVCFMQMIEKDGCFNRQFAKDLSLL